MSKVQSKRTLKTRKMKLHIKFLDFMVIIFGILGWCFLAWFIWSGYLYGGSSGFVLYRWNAHKEMIIELILINGIIVIMLIYLFIRVFGIKRKRRK